VSAVSFALSVLFFESAQAQSQVKSFEHLPFSQFVKTPANNINTQDSLLYDFFSTPWDDSAWAIAKNRERTQSIPDYNSKIYAELSHIFYDPLMQYLFWRDYGMEIAGKSLDSLSVKESVCFLSWVLATKLSPPDSTRGDDNLDAVSMLSSSETTAECRNYSEYMLVLFEALKAHNSALQNYYIRYTGSHLYKHARNTIYKIQNDGDTIKVQFSSIDMTRIDKESGFSFSHGTTSAHYLFETETAKRIDAWLLLDTDSLAQQECKELYLSNPSITDISGLSSLTTLNLTSYPLDSLPTGIEKLPQLKEIMIREKNLTAVPQVFLEGHELMRLDVTFNDITELPQQWVSTLIELYTSHNQIRSIPAHIKNYENLQALYCSGNDILEVSHNIWKLSELHTLVIRDNSHLYELPHSIRKLKNLRHLDISGTKIIKSSLPRNILAREQAWLLKIID